MDRHTDPPPPKVMPRREESPEEERRRGATTDPRLKGDQPKEVAEAVPGRAEVRAAAARCAVLGDATRLRLLAVVRTASAIVIADLAKIAEVERTVTSHHMQKARRAGLVKRKTVGKYGLYSLTRAGEEMLEAVLPV